MDTDGWITKVAYKNWINTFSLNEDLIYQEKGIIAVVNPQIPLIFINTVLQTELAIQDVNQTIELIISKYQDHNLEFCWSITPFTKPGNFEEYLKKYEFKEVGKVPHMGLIHSEFDKNKLELELEETDLEIRKIGIEDLEAYMDPLSVGFGISENEQLMIGFKKFVTDLLEFIPKNSPSGLFLGYVDDKPVTTSMGYISAGVMGIYNIATIPEYRKRGYGRLMTADLIIKSINAELRGSILQSSDMGKRVYEKLGFETKYYQKQFKIEKELQIT